MNLVTPITIAACACCCCYYLYSYFFQKKNRVGSTVESDDNRTDQEVNQVVDSVLSHTEYRPFQLIKKECLTQGPDVKNPVYLFRFALPRESDTLGLSIGHHIKIKGYLNKDETQSSKNNNEDNSDETTVVRSYSPVSTNDDKGYFDIVVKLYPSGKMSQYLSRLQVGDYVQVMGPHGRFSYEPNMHKELFMIAGGSGITPILQVIKEIIRNRHEDQTRMTLLYGNISEGDIILREELEEMQRNHPDILKLIFVLKDSPEGWIHESGFIDKEIIMKYLPVQTTDENREQVKVLLCGSPTLIKVSKEVLLNHMGYNRQQIFTF